MDALTDPQLLNLQGLQQTGYHQPSHANISSQLDADFDAHQFQSYALNNLANASVNSPHLQLSSSNAFAQANLHAQDQLPSRTRLQARSTGQYEASTRSSANPYALQTQYAFTPGNMRSAQSNQGTPYTQLQHFHQNALPAAATSNRSVQTHSSLANENLGSSHFSGMKVVPNPPNLAEWRERLFNVTEPVTMSEEEFQTYFPHIDNVYSHRSTQKYKRRPFVSHYWDCRLKGRPPGTAKSDDPSKRKRKRTARERDLCDVKIKITEFFSAAEIGAAAAAHADARDGSNLTFIMDGSETHGHVSSDPSDTINQAFGVLAPSSTLPADHPGANGEKYYTIQRVQGNANTSTAGDGGTDDIGALHKHSLEDSDKIKKNSVQRYLLKEEKERKKSNLNPTHASHDDDLPTNQDTTTTASTSPTYPFHRASGPASQTMQLHQSPMRTTDPNALIFFANPFCPFAQRVWIALEIKQIPYQFVEVVPAYMGGSGVFPPELLEVCPVGQVPAIRHGDWGVWESGVMMEYLEDLSVGFPLLPIGEDQGRLRAHCRLWVDHINRKILPAFYALLLSPPIESLDGNTMTLPGDSSIERSFPKHAMLVNTLHTTITALVNASHATGPFFMGPHISYVDVVFAPWIIRLSRVLSFYRKYPDPRSSRTGGGDASLSPQEQRWQRWVDAVEADERVRATTSSEESYHNVYQVVGDCGIRGLDFVAEGGRGGVETRSGTDSGAKLKRAMAEMEYARTVVRAEGFGLGGDTWGHHGDGL